MRPTLGFLLLILLAPFVLLTLLNVVPDELIVFPIIGTFASWLLSRFAK